jgi:hypothetical protein
MQEHLKFYINGEWVAPLEPKTLTVENPANEDAFALISLGAQADVDKAVAAAKNAFPAFSQSSVEERIDLLEKIVAALQARGDELNSDQPRNGGADVVGKISPSRRSDRALRDSRSYFTGLSIQRSTRHYYLIQRTCWCMWFDHAVELASQPSCLQGRTGARHRLHHGLKTIRNRASRCLDYGGGLR